jgi:hypothetical protein
VVPHLSAAVDSQGLGLLEYSLALDALDLRQPRLLQHPGKDWALI